MSVFSPYTHVDLVFTFPDGITTTKAVVEDADDDHLILGVAQVPVQLCEGEVLFITLVRQGEACYSVPTTVVSVGPGRSVTVEAPDEDAGLRIQTREYFRVRAVEAVQVFPVGQPGFTSWTRNLSAGGMLVEAVQPLAVGTVCRVVVPMPDGDIALAARVIRAEPGATAFVFQAVSDAERNRMIRGLRQLEQRLRRKP